MTKTAMEPTAICPVLQTQITGMKPAIFLATTGALLIACVFMAGYSTAKRGERNDRCMIVSCIGDSITEGHFETGRKDPSKAYPAILKESLFGHKEKAWSVLNNGKGGDTAKDGLNRLERDVYGIIQTPHIVVVAFGTNDVTKRTADQFRSHLRKIVRKCQKHGSKVVLVTPPFLRTNPKGVTGKWAHCAPKFAELQNNGKVAEFAQIVRDVAREENTELADVYAEWSKYGKDTDSMLANGLNHPTETAQYIHAALIDTAIRRLMP